MSLSAGLPDTFLPLPSSVRPWRVLHACETLSDAALLAEAQSDIGMFPQVLSHEIWNPTRPAAISLLNAWHDVRDWRHSLNHAEALNDFQVIHAHSFASAMAGVRGTLPLVYDFSATIEEVAAQQTSSGVWLVRSLRVAEQFVLSRASAVVTHSELMRRTAQDRGAPPEHLFVIPEPFVVEDNPFDQQWALGHNLDRENHTVLFAAVTAGDAQFVLGAFSAMLTECSDAVLVLECHLDHRDAVLATANELNIADSIRFVTPAERLHALACVDVVLVQPHPTQSKLMLVAMASGRAIVAADIPAHRDFSPDGQGCIWFRDGDLMDLAHRGSFVARNRDFARGLGESGRSYVRLNRSRISIAQHYDAVYRHAIVRRTENIPRLPMPKLYALGEA